MPSLTLWSSPDAERAQRECRDAVTLCGAVVTPWKASMPTGSPVLVPVDAMDGVIAVLLRPQGKGGRVTVNGASVPVGMRLLQHGNRIEVPGAKYWVASAARPLEEIYDPARHGADQFCFLTKARLQCGDVLWRCPGPPGQSCGMLYLKRAWEDLGCACHSCGWDPAAGGWAPPVEKKNSRVAELLGWSTTSPDTAEEVRQ